MNMLDIARAYQNRGWSVLALPYQSKKPAWPGWQRLRLQERDLPLHFNGHPQNIGVLLGEPSGWLVDVDLDHPRCLELADQYLPATPAVFGRVGKPRSHRIYRASSPVVTRQFKSRSAGPLVELRSTGAQTVFPPSTHPSGEAIAWEVEDAEPARVEASELLAAVTQLAAAVKIELGEKSVPKVRQARAPKAAPTSPADRASSPDRIAACVAAMLKMGLSDHKDGSHRLFAAACRVVEHDLSEAEGIRAIRDFAAQQPFPKEWTDQDILDRIRDAESKTQRGKAVQAGGAYAAADSDPVRLGARDPESGRLVLSPQKTLPTAEAFLREFYSHPTGRTLHNYAGLLWVWQGNRYVPIEEDAIRKQLQPWLHQALRYVVDRRTRMLVLVDFESNPGTVKNALESIRPRVYLPADSTPPCWLSGGARLPDPRELVSFASGHLHIPTGRILAPTPDLFSTCALDFDYDPQAPEPTNWLSFLGQLFEDDLQAWDLLQQWCGYCLTADTSQQKMLLLIGPRRSGKGTVARVLARLVGATNVCGPTTSSLAGPFGLQPLLGKSLAIVSDARFSGENIQTVIERLLCISGEDAVTVDRKHTTSVTMKLPIRFMFLTNEIPRLADASGALSGRFVILRLTESFFGREDITLSSKLLTELPGILNWGIEGWRRLQARGRFVQPASVEETLRDLEDLSSPVKAFIRERCYEGPSLRVWIDDLYAAWKTWCEADGRITVTIKQVFCRDLLAAFPRVSSHLGTGDRRFYRGIGLRGVEA